MAEFQRSANALWNGDLRTGAGTVSTQSGALSDAKVTFVSRFENAQGSNPEELIAAAQAACYSMALSADLGRAGYAPESIATQATVTLRMNEQGPKIAKIHLTVSGAVPGIDQAAFSEIAEKTKQNCPVSKLLTPGLEEMTLEAILL